MSEQNNIGILGIGTYLPKEIRENSWWPPEVVKTWVDDKRRFSSAFDLDALDLEDLSPEAKILIETLNNLKRNPDVFEGSKIRHIMAPNEKTTDMEIKAAFDALKNAGISPNKLDFVITQTTLPDILLDANACIVHKALKLPSNCFSLEVLGMCNAFLQQLFVAQGLIKSGTARYGLLIQSSGMSRLIEPQHPSAPFFGDGATAIIVGSVPSTQGMLSIKNHTNGGLGSYFTTGIPGKRWYDEGRIKTHILDVSSGPLLNFNAVEQSKLLIESALVDAHLEKAALQFYAGHQGMSWFREVTQKTIDIPHAKSYDTFGMHASLVGANIPLVLCLAAQNNLLKKGDNIAAFSPGSGMTASGMIMKWMI
ncbi:MAG TPA: 3-oxoacyl-[acyl-carrier-protein] synthase III C-terminal domain-containing protein [Gammaproteobacteria bacterium]|nr:3-oxoacyl-[acyl-carrier-protein] synthase III C-terminal domain-containing protein [Gammaproteobacteria bacterium]